VIYKLLGLACIVSASPSPGAVITFTDRTAWLAALSQPVTFYENFSEFTVDTPFSSSPLNVGPFSLAPNAPQGFRNIIDVPPLDFADNDGTANASIFTDFGITTVLLTPDAPLLAFGGDFWGPNTNEGLDLLLTLDAGPPILLVPNWAGGFGSAQFFGFTTTGGERILTIQFQSRNDLASGEGFGLDEIQGVTVPEPAALSLVLTGLTALAFCRRRGGIAPGR
jgi:hypothetical protein